MFNAIEAHCLGLLRDCAHRKGLRKRRPVGCRTGDEGVSRAQRRKTIDVRRMPCKLLLKTNCLSFALLSYFVRINQMQHIAQKDAFRNRHVFYITSCYLSDSC